MALPSNTKRKIFDGRYEVLSIVGRGTDSVVYHARHIQGSQQEVALKVLLNQKSQVSLAERLRKEALTLVSCRHRYVVRLDDFHSVDELCYLSMEYAAQGDLRKVISDLQSALPPDRGEAYLRQCLEALDFIHATGVVHRDIKPDNILVVSEKEIRLADFGLALLPGDEVDIDELQKGVGSFSYLPPELVEGLRYDERSDLYALGLCFYEALAGFHPFDKLPLADQLEARKEGKIAPLHEIQPSVPHHVSEVIGKLIRYDAEERYQTALEALRALDNKQAAPASLQPAAVEPKAANADSVTLSAVASNSAQTAAANAPDTASNFLDDDLDLELDDDDSTGDEPTPEAKPTERSPQPTEEIDIARIKEILAKDSQKKADLSASRQKSSEGLATRSKAEPNRTEGYNLQPKPASQKQAGSPRNPAARARSGLHRLFRVGVGAAAITIIAIMLLENVPKLLGAHSSPPSVSQQESFNPLEAPQRADATASDPSDGDLDFPVVPGGLYSGGIEGVIPGVRSPFALISFPGKNELVVIIGIEGWTPVVSSTLEEGSPDTHTIVVRSNGVVLNLTGELSSDSITGTFVNTMTGETGTWSAKKAP